MGVVDGGGGGAGGVVAFGLGVTEGVTEGDGVVEIGFATGVTEGVLLALGRRNCGTEPSSVTVMVW